MSFVVAVPEALAAASANVGSIASAVSAANTVAGQATTHLAAAAEDEVSAAIAVLFSGHAQQFQSLSAQAAVFHADFVHALRRDRLGHLRHQRWQ